jgi:Tol biopolymer transport system component
MAEHEPDGARKFGPDERLEGWKEIGSYLNRPVRTLQRWKWRGLPVYRHGALGAVYAFKPELDAWLQEVGKEEDTSEIPKPESDTAAATKTERQLPFRAWIGMGVLCLLVIAVLASWWQDLRSIEGPFKVVPLNSLPGSAIFPAFAPDGHAIAFSWKGEKEESFSIYVQVIGTGTPFRLTSGAVADLCPTWSPDGRYIAFIRTSQEGGGIFLIPSLPGAERKLAEVHPTRSEVLGGQLAWSRDGRSLAIVDKNTAEDPFSIYLFSIQDGKRQKLTSPPAGSVGDSDPIFSPDGRMLAFVRTTEVGIKDVYVVSLLGRAVERLTFDNTYIYGETWAPKTSDLVFSSNRSGAPGLWRISASGCAPLLSYFHMLGPCRPKRLIGVGERALYPTISPQGDQLTYTNFSVNTNIWQLKLPVPPNGDNSVTGSSPKPLIVSTRHSAGPQFSPDGRKIVFASDRSGSFEIWVCDADGKNLMKLTSFGASAGAGSPRWSPDGIRIVFDARAEGNANIYIIRAQGGEATRLTSDRSENVVPSWSRDGQWIYFASNRSGSHQIWKMATDGSKALQLTKKGGFAPFESPDRKFICYAKGRSVPGLWKVPVNGGEETVVLEPLRRNFWGLWTVVAKGIYFLDFIGPNGTAPAAVKFFSFASNSTTQVATLEKLRFVHYQGLTVSPDEKAILYPQLDQTAGEVMLVEDFR